MEHRATAPGGTPVGRPMDDAGMSGVGAFGAGLAAALVLVGAVVWMFFTSLREAEPRQARPEYPLAVERPSLPPEPRLQTRPREDLRALRAEEDSVLTTYGWIDRRNGIVHIPIDRAMALTVERGLSARSGTED